MRAGKTYFTTKSGKKVSVEKNYPGINLCFSGDLGGSNRLFLTIPNKKGLPAGEGL
jgi:hypothetical protein